MSSRLQIEPEDRHEAGDEPAPRRQVVRAVLLGLAVAGLVGGSWWAGHSSKPAPQDLSAVPEIHPDTAPVKIAPANPGGMQVPDQDSILLNQEGKQQPEELLPPPEAVKQRPVSAMPPAPPTPPPASQPPAPQQTASAPPPVAPKPVPQPAPAPQIVPAPPPPASVVPQAKAAQTTAAASGAYRLQLGALGSEEAAKQEWLRLQRQQPDVLGKLSLAVSRVDLGAKGVYFRIQAGPIASAAQAAQSCATLKSRNVGCILVKP
jgi:outer membrane biosynthesis protein TonB